MEQRESNYEVMRHRMAEDFLKYDVSDKIKVWNLETDEEYIYLTFVADDYRVIKKNGDVEVKVNGDWAASNYMSAMTIYDLLCYAQNLARASGNYCPMQSLSSVLTRDTYAGKGMFANDTEYFASHGGAFCKACEALGGYAWGKGDYGYKLPVFRDLEIALQVYEADEDFEAQMTLLTDQNSLMYMHYETLWFMVSHVIVKIREKMEALI